MSRRHTVGSARDGLTSAPGFLPQDCQRHRGGRHAVPPRAGPTRQDQRGFAHIRLFDRFRRGDGAARPVLVVPQERAPAATRVAGNRAAGSRRCRCGAISTRGIDWPSSGGIGVRGACSRGPGRVRRPMTGGANGQVPSKASSTAIRMGVPSRRRRGRRVVTRHRGVSTPNGPDSWGARRTHRTRLHAGPGHPKGPARQIARAGPGQRPEPRHRRGGAYPAVSAHPTALPTRPRGQSPLGQPAGTSPWEPAPGSQPLGASPLGASPLEASPWEPAPGNQPLGTSPWEPAPWERALGTGPSEAARGPARGPA